MTAALPLPWLSLNDARCSRIEVLLTEFGAGLAIKRTYAPMKDMFDRLSGDVRALLSVGARGPSALRIRCHFQAVPAKLHAAPAPRAFFASVKKVQYALIALTDTLAVCSGKQHCGAVRQRSK